MTSVKDFHTKCTFKTSSHDFHSFVLHFHATARSPAVPKIFFTISNFGRSVVLKEREITIHDSLSRSNLSVGGVCGVGVSQHPLEAARLCEWHREAVQRVPAADAGALVPRIAKASFDLYKGGADQIRWTPLQKTHSLRL